MYRILILLFITKFGFGQTNIRGTVSDGQTKETLIGANIVIKGENKGTSTNINGKFSISTNKTYQFLLLRSIFFHHYHIGCKLVPKLKGIFVNIFN